MSKTKISPAQLSLWGSEDVSQPAAAGQSLTIAQPPQLVIPHNPTKLWFYDGGREIVCDGAPGYYERFYGPDATERDLHGVWSCQFIGRHAFYPEECPVCNPDLPWSAELCRF
jgi:hypothetical protein